MASTICQLPFGKCHLIVIRLSYYQIVGNDNICIQNEPDLCREIISHVILKIYIFRNLRHGTSVLSFKVTSFILYSIEIKNVQQS